MNNALDSNTGNGADAAPARRSLGDALDVFPIALGTNAFAWTSSRDEAFDVLDAYTAGGGNFIDTADMYPQWAEGRDGGESEAIIGEWLDTRGARDELVIATKAGSHHRLEGLAPDTIRAAADASLQRLGIDTIDLYYAHHDDPGTPLVESLAAFSELVDAGKVRYLAISNYSPERVREWLEITDREGFHRPVALQPHYNLMERGIEADLLPVARESGLGVVPYYGLAQGFLTGKYREGAVVSSQRAEAVEKYRTPRGERVVSAITGIAGRLKVQPGAVALAWLLAQPGVVAPIASARTASHVPLLLEAARIALDPSELEELDRASSPERDTD